MPIELWGATEGSRLLLPSRPVIGVILLLLLALAVGYLAFQLRPSFRRMTRGQWLTVLLLSAASLTIGQLFPITLTLNHQLPPLGTTQDPQTTLTLFAAVPFLLAAASLNPAAALVVGFCAGLGRAFWHTHLALDPLFFALGAVTIGWWLRQSYEGRVYRWLRVPVIAAPAAMLLLLPLYLPIYYSYASAEATRLAALDWAISTTGAQLLPLFIEGLFGGGIVSLILATRPEWRFAPRELVPAPHARSVRKRLLLNFVVFAVLLSSALVAVVFTLAVDVATQLSANQMAHDAEAVAQQIPTFRNQLQNLLRQHGSDPVLRRGGDAVVEEYLAEIVQTAGANYRRIILVDAGGTVSAFYPNRDLATVTLTNMEQEAIADALTRGAPTITPAQLLGEGEQIISFVVPVTDDGGVPVAALVGRVPGIALDDLVIGLQGTVGEGRGFILDERNQIIADGDTVQLLPQWTLPDADSRRGLSVKVDAPGIAYEGLDSETNARELIYYQKGPDHPWKVVIAVPYQVVLRLALQISTPLMIVLAVAMAAFAANLAYLGRGITAPLGELVRASQQLAAGNWDVSVPARNPDEVGQLGQAFERMRRSMQRQFRDVNLMLEVSRDISTTIDVQEGIPIILRGAVRGTGAAGMRAVVLNPNGRHPLTFGEGPAAEEMTVFDRRIALLARQEREIALTTPEQVRVGLRLAADQEVPVQALLAVALYAKDRFQGVLWIGYRQAHEFNNTELSLVRTMSSQASVLVENARLFATAEGQRRRLAAVLASTSDAVIVTDQTERILLLNPAMARAFNLAPHEVVGRPVASVIDNRHLLRILTEREERVRNLELPLDDGRILYASVSTIMSNDQQVLGRVAVLHDITRLKELDEMKSEFVATVSHDLRGPLTFIRGYLTMLPMVGDINEKQEEYIDKILNGVQTMSSLIEDLLDLGRIEAGVFLMEDAVDPEELLLSVAEEQAGHAAMVGLRLKVECEPNLPSVAGDASLIRRAVVNLVGNAIKYAPQTEHVMLNAVKEDDEIVFSVKDSGPGISKQDQIRLFEKFYRVKSKATSNVKGSGLGLAIVKSIVERHGGRVWCHSLVNKGSTFYFSLPLERRSA